MIFLLETLTATLIYGFLAFLFYRCSADNIQKMEKLCRSRIAGLLLSLPCALLCVPLAVPVSPGFLLPLLYPAAVVIPLLCYFYIDCYAARGLAFLLILWAYDAVHFAFEEHIPGAPAVTLLALALGSAGIWLAAKPCALRDLFRAAARRELWKNISAAGAAAGALTALYLFIMMIGVLVK